MDMSDKCERCHRRSAASKGIESCHCQLRKMAALTLPWVIEALKLADANERKVRIGRVLRGDTNSPGFINDWRDEHALKDSDVEDLTRTILNAASAEDVTIALLCAPCRLFIG